MAWNGNSTIQRPSLQFFIEKKAKNLAIYQIFPENNIRQKYCDQNSIASLCLDTSTLNFNTFVLFGKSNALVLSRLLKFQYYEIA